MRITIFALIRQTVPSKNVYRVRFIRCDAQKVIVTIALYHHIDVFSLVAVRLFSCLLLLRGLSGTLSGHVWVSSDTLGTCHVH